MNSLLGGADRFEDFVFRDIPMTTTIRSGAPRSTRCWSLGLCRVGAACGDTRTHGAVVLLGFAVQLIGVAVNVSVNEWKRKAAGIVNKNEWVFVPGASPIGYHL